MNTQLYAIKHYNDLGVSLKRPTGAWGWMVLLNTPKLEDSLGGATHRSLYISE